MPFTSRSLILALTCTSIFTAPSLTFATQSLTEGVQMMPPDGSPVIVEQGDNADAEDTAIRAEIPARASVKWQNYGLLTNQGHGALPPTLWDDQDWATEVRPALAALPKDTISRVQRMLVRNTLLSQVDVEVIDDIPNDDDYLKARLENLLRNGSFEEIVSYYNTIPEGERPAHLYPVAFAAMAGLGRFSVSCLEMKVQGSAIGTADPLPAIQAFCTNLLQASASPTPDRKAGMNLSGEMARVQELRSKALQQAANRYLDARQVPAKISLTEFAQMDIVTAQAANLADRIASPPSTQLAAALRPIPSSHLAILLAVPPADDGLRFAVFASALQRGLMPIRDMTTQYKVLAAPRKTKSPESAPLWEKLVLLKHQLNNAAETPAQIAILNKALALFPAAYTSYGPLAVAPFMQDIITLYPDMDAAGDQSRLILRLLLASNNTSPTLGQVAQRAFALPAAPVDSEDLFRSLKLTSWGAASTQEYIATYLDARKVLQGIGAGQALNFDALPGLTNPDNYVIPPKDVAKSLVSAFNSDNAGSVVLASLKVLQGQAASATHPSVLALIVELYKRVGYEQEAQQLLSEVLADLLAQETTKKDKGV